MRTLRGGSANQEDEKRADMKNKKSNKKDFENNVDDDVGANGDETTDDEGGVDTPPPPREEDEDSKEEKAETEENETSKEEEEVEEEEKKEEVEAKDDGEYEVEQIVDMELQKRRKCPVNFRVRWLGFSEKEDSWLPASELACDDLVQEFLEISGRKSEYERAFESRKRSADRSTESCRQSSRKVSRITYSELDEDQDEILPSGTRTRKVKTKAEKKEMPGTGSSKKKTKKKGGRPAKKQITNKPQQQEFEVERIIDHRVKGRFTDYKIRWKGFGPKHDEWISEADLNCPSLVKAYTKKNQSASPEKEEAFEVESIAGMRETKGRVEYKVRWKNWGPKYDSWLPEDELNCPEILNNFKTVLDKLEKQEDWQVEKILDSRERKGKTEYLIHWKDFESKFDTWEPKENLEGCQDIFEKYVKEKEKEKNKLLNSGRKTREERSRPERYVENFTGGSRSRSKRRTAGASYSEFYDQ